MTLPQQPRPRLSSFQSLASSVLPNPFGALISLRAPPPSPAPPPLSHDIHMHLSTQCHSCGEAVAVEVPGWMTDAMEGRRSSERLESLDGGRPGKVDRREGFVGAAVRIAVAIKESPIPTMCVAIVAAVFSFVLFLDQQFSLHQRLAVLVSKILESLIEIEKEVGLFRNAGETVSVLWEAAVKSTIAMATSPSPSANAPPSDAPFSAEVHPFEPLPNLTRRRTLRTVQSTSSLPLLRGPSSLGPSQRPSSIPFPVNPSSSSERFSETLSGMRHRRSRSEELEFGLEGLERQRTVSEAGEPGMGWGARVVGGVVGRVGRAVGGS